MAEESIKEISLRSDTRTSIAERARTAGASGSEVDIVTVVCEKVLYRHFHEQGLILAAFLEKQLTHVTISDQIVEEELRGAASDVNDVSKAAYGIALKVLQGIFYTPTEVENEFLHRLSKTTLLLFTLKHNPRLIEYFNKMSGRFRLLIGADIIVKALAETFLPEEHKHVTNLLKVARACGATLIASEPVVEEVFTHMHATQLEFRNYYASQEPYITAALASQSDRILIRTYFYAKLLINKVKGWRGFIEMFVDFDQLAAASGRGQAQLQAYLCKVYGFEYMPREDLARGVDGESVRDLAAKLQYDDKKEVLAQNDALMCMAVYAQRALGREAMLYDGFGLRTWWLTKETALLQHTGAVVAAHGNVPFIMRPEFLLNFLSISPQTADVDPVVRDLLPNHVGLQIGQHLSATHMHKILGHVSEWSDLPDSRREVKITDAVDKLKWDRLKRYEANLDLKGEDEADAVVSALRNINGL
ncbi:hypothetical protein ASB57_11840 [Bordetella sp. N]|nr:hypothetical protein ASB57_11840 [Bordetella sp. N]